MKTFIRLLIPVAMLQGFACSDPADQPSSSGSGGSAPEGTTSSSASSGTGGNPDQAASSSASTGAGDTPVECQDGEGAPAGAACAEEGELCDFACSGCWVTCTDGVWVEHCASCPSAPPEDGTDCTDHDAETSCSYELDCGTTTATCDGPTGLWQVDQLDCGAGGQGGGGSQGGEGGEGGGGGEEDDGGGCG